MSSRRRSSRSSSSAAVAARITDEQISELLSKLQAAFLPHHRGPLRSTDVSAGRVLQEACSRIRSLQREADDLSERLSELLADSDDITGAQAAALIRRFA